MEYVTLFIALTIIAVVAYLLIKKVFPQMVLLVAGIVMISITILLTGNSHPPENPTGFIGFDIFAVLKDSFSTKMAGIGLMIMTIGGYVRYMKHIGASEMLVSVTLKPLARLKKYPYLATVLLIPIGQFLFMSSPSAAGFSMLLMVAIYPVIVRFGVSKITAVSVITACTVFDLGPGSANANQAAHIIGMDVVDYFLSKQVVVVIPTTFSLMVLYFFVNKYSDRKMKYEPVDDVEEHTMDPTIPKFYALLPVLPLILLVVFSAFFEIFTPPVILNTTLAMLICMFVTYIIELIRTRHVRKTTEDTRIFFDGMGTVFSTIVTLIVCADIFARGLIGLGLIDMLIAGSQSIGMGNTGVNGIMTSAIFASSVLMGSGNASFFAFSPLVPDIIANLGGSEAQMILPMQLASSMGRAVSPIAGLMIATSKMADISSFDVARRNLIPLAGGAIVMFTLNALLL